MRRRRDHVHARRLRKVDVLRARRIGVHERSRAIEILRVRQQVKHLRDGVRSFGLGEQRIGDAGFRIGRRSVGERKQIDREEDVEELQRVARCLAEAMVERPAAGAADLIEDAVEDFAALLVGIEALIQKVAQKSSTLRHAPTDCVAQARRRVVRRSVVFEKADEVSRAGEAASEHARIRRAVHNVVDSPRFESAFDRDVLRADEAPSRTRYDRSFRGRFVAHRHDVLGGVRIEDRICQMIAIGERRRRRLLVENEISAHDAGDSLAVFRGNRHLHSHRAGALRHVPLPSHPEQGKPLAHQRAVSEFGLGCRIGRSCRLLKRLQDRFAAAVADFVEEATVCTARIDRLQQKEISARLHLAARILRREFQIDDDVVARVRGIEAEVDLADQLLVRTGGAERPPVQYRLAALDPQAYDARFCDGRSEHD